MDDYKSYLNSYRACLNKKPLSVSHKRNLLSQFASENYALSVQGFSKSGFIFVLEGFKFTFF